jgi:hypothetical protein
MCCQWITTELTTNHNIKLACNEAAVKTVWNLQDSVIVRGPEQSEMYWVFTCLFLELWIHILQKARTTKTYVELLNGVLFLPVFSPVCITRIRHILKLCIEETASCEPGQ